MVINKENDGLFKKNQGLKNEIILLINDKDSQIKQSILEIRKQKQNNSSLQKENEALKVKNQKEIEKYLKLKLDLEDKIQKAKIQVNIVEEVLKANKSE